MDIVDLSLPLSTGMPVPPGDPPVEIGLARSLETDGYQVSHLSLGSHSGTHLDAPRHFFADGVTLDAYPLDRLIGPGVIVDCRPQTTGSGVVDAAHLRERLTACPVPSGGFVLLWTEGKLLSLEGAELLAEAGASLVGTDAPSLDAEPYPVHRLLLGRGILLAENLCRLNMLGPGPVTCVFLPLAFAGADGAPMRAAAWRRGFRT